MYIFICDNLTSPSSLHKAIYNFYSDVLSNMDVDSLTNKEINLELKKREISKSIRNGIMVLIFKKF